MKKSVVSGQGVFSQQAAEDTKPAGPAPSLRGSNKWQDKPAFAGQSQHQEQVREKHDIKVQVFTLPADAQAWAELLSKTKAQDPTVHVRYRRQEFHQASGKFIIYAEWVELEYMDVTS